MHICQFNLYCLKVFFLKNVELYLKVDDVRGLVRLIKIGTFVNLDYSL